MICRTKWKWKKPKRLSRHQRFAKGLELAGPKVLRAVESKARHHLWKRKKLFLMVNVVLLKRAKAPTLEYGISTCFNQVAPPRTVLERL